MFVTWSFYLGIHPWVYRNPFITRTIYSRPEAVVMPFRTGIMYNGIALARYLCIYTVIRGSVISTDANTTRSPRFSVILSSSGLTGGLARLLLRPNYIHLSLEHDSCRFNTYVQRQRFHFLMNPVLHSCASNANFPRIFTKISCLVRASFWSVM